ncbi:MAG: hypothetical protein HFG28_12850 [Eubacterium sp.]|nr:hypothetical protein [Eubacterium sp.]
MAELFSEEEAKEIRWIFELMAELFSEEEAKEIHRIFELMAEHFITVIFY